MKVLAAIVITCVSTLGAFAETSVWKVQNGGNVLYLGGTVHLLRETDYPLPEAFNDAFTKSEVIVFEAPDDDVEDIIGSESLKDFIAMASEVGLAVQTDEKVKMYVDMTSRFNTMIVEHEKVYKSFTDKTIELTDEEKETSGRMMALAVEIMEMSGGEEIKDFLDKAMRMALVLQEDEEIMAFMSIFANPGFASLETIMSDEVYGSLKALCDKYGYPIDGLKHLKPSIADTILTGHVVRQFATAKGVDHFFMAKAAEASKKIEYFETSLFQYNLMGGDGIEYDDAYYAHSFASYATAEEDFDRLVDSWRNGTKDIDSMLYDRENFPEHYKAIVADRNNTWIPIIDGYLDTEITEFILVGNGHMHGPDGLVTQLTKKGYRIEQQR
jgi:uncharacterized protein YbaP (TraB family)